MARVGDLLEAANWQRGGGKGSQPKPLPRPTEMHEAALSAERHEARARRFIARQQRRQAERE